MIQRILDFGNPFQDIAGYLFGEEIIKKHKDTGIYDFAGTSFVFLEINQESNASDIANKNIEIVLRLLLQVHNAANMQESISSFKISNIEHLNQIIQRNLNAIHAIDKTTYQELSLLQNKIKEIKDANLKISKIKGKKKKTDAINKLENKKTEISDVLLERIFKIQREVNTNTNISTNTNTNTNTNRYAENYEAASYASSVYDDLKKSLVVKATDARSIRNSRESTIVDKSHLDEFVLKNSTNHSFSLDIVRRNNTKSDSFFRRMNTIMLTRESEIKSRRELIRTIDSFSRQEQVTIINSLSENSTELEENISKFYKTGNSGNIKASEYRYIREQLIHTVQKAGTQEIEQLKDLIFKNILQKRAYQFINNEKKSTENISYEAIEKSTGNISYETIENSWVKQGSQGSKLLQQIEIIKQQQLKQAFDNSVYSFISNKLGHIIKQNYTYYDDGYNNFNNNIQSVSNINLYSNKDNDMNENNDKSYSYNSTCSYIKNLFTRSVSNTNFIDQVKNYVDDIKREFDNANNTLQVQNSYSSSLWTENKPNERFQIANNYKNSLLLNNNQSSSNKKDFWKVESTRVNLNNTENYYEKTNLLLYPDFSRQVIEFVRTFGSKSNMTKQSYVNSDSLKKTIAGIDIYNMKNQNLDYNTENHTDNIGKQLKINSYQRFLSMLKLTNYSYRSLANLQKKHQIITNLQQKHQIITNLQEETEGKQENKLNLLQQNDSNYLRNTEINHVKDGTSKRDLVLNQITLHNGKNIFQNNMTNDASRYNYSNSNFMTLNQERIAPLTLKNKQAHEKPEKTEVGSEVRTTEVELLKVQSKRNQQEAIDQKKKVKRLEDKLEFQQKLIEEINGKRVALAEGVAPDEIQRIKKEVINLIQKELRLEKQRRGMD